MIWIYGIGYLIIGIATSVVVVKINKHKLCNFDEVTLGGVVVFWWAVWIFFFLYGLGTLIGTITHKIK